MNTVLFGIAFGLAMAYTIWKLLSTPRVTELRSVKAGKVSDYFPSTFKVNYAIPSVIYSDGKKIYTSSYQTFYVHGNSMIKYEINDGDKILVEELTDKHSIKDFPVLMLGITDVRGDDACYKLRKFISYVVYEDGYSWESLFDDYKSRISISKESFVDQCKKKVSSSLLAGKSDLVLSETYNEKNKVNEYSLHPVETIYGKVMYAF